MLEEYHKWISAVTTTDTMTENFNTASKTNNVILLIGAQGSVRPVHGAVNELHDIEKLFESRFKGKNFQIESKENVDSNILKDILSKHRNQIRILHFAGHSTSDTLALNDGEIAIELVCRYLKNWKYKPDLVFINGCNSSGMVEHFQNAGVACVIAARIRVNDDKARQFAINFYDELLHDNQHMTVQAAFDDGSVFLRGGVNGRFARSLGQLEIKQIDDAKNNWDWGVFSKNGWQTTQTIQSISNNPIVSDSVINEIVGEPPLLRLWEKIQHRAVKGLMNSWMLLKCFILIAVLLLFWYLPINEEVDIFYSEMDNKEKASIDPYPKHYNNDDFKEIKVNGSLNKVSVIFHPFVMRGEFILVYRANRKSSAKKCRRYTVTKYFQFFFDNKEVSDEYRPC